MNAEEEEEEVENALYHAFFFISINKEAHIPAPHNGPLSDGE